MSGPLIVGFTGLRSAASCRVYTNESLYNVLMYPNISCRYSRTMHMACTARYTSKPVNHFVPMFSPSSIGANGPALVAS